MINILTVSSTNMIFYSVLTQWHKRDFVTIQYWYFFNYVDLREKIVSVVCTQINSVKFSFENHHQLQSSHCIKPLNHYGGIFARVLLSFNFFICLLFLELLLCEFQRLIFSFYLEVKC